MPNKSLYVASIAVILLAIVIKGGKLYEFKKKFTKTIFLHVIFILPLRVDYSTNRSAKVRRAIFLFLLFLSDFILFITIR